MDVAGFLERICQTSDYQGQLQHVETLPERPGQFGQPSRPLPGLLQDVLVQQGVASLYSHQVEVLEHARRAQDTVVVTGTASGKTLCYNLPILEGVLTKPEQRALYLFPTKALAQDQQKSLLELVSCKKELADRVNVGVYDGDTPTAQRRRIRAEANLVLSNPDMVHASLLPYHPKWGGFFEHLRYVVLDEVHTYRGIFGAHVAAVLQRLERVCAHYGTRPIVLAASATIANPGAFTERLTGRDVAVVDRDGSPRGRKYFALWNPRPHAKDRLARGNATDDAVRIMVDAILDDGQVLAFTRTRQAAELIHRYAKQDLERRQSPRARQIRAYRGGYLPDERRKIEQDLSGGHLRGVAATNALELGIDIGSLDVALLVHYPGTIASAWQQAGRSGRRHNESLAILLAGNDPVDQYLLRHPAYFFAQTPEHAVVDPENPYVLAKHLKAAAFELPLTDEDFERFGPLAGTIARMLCEEKQLSEVGGQFYFAGGQNPATGVSLRHMSDNTFSIVLQSDPTTRPHKHHTVIANVDAISAPELVYPEAVYLHDGESYLVRELDLNGKVAYVERRETDYYTQAVLDSNVQMLDGREASTRIPHADMHYGDVDVSWQTVAFKKIKFDTRENIGMGPVDIPAQNLATTAVWLAPDRRVQKQLAKDGLRMTEALVGLRNLAVVALPIVAMCDSRDLGGVVDTKNLGRGALILYDRYPGGLGYCEQGFQQMKAVLAICHDMVGKCDCLDGCPSCVGMPNLRPAIHSDPDLTRGYPMPNKDAALRLLNFLCETSAGTTEVSGAA